MNSLINLNSNKNCNKFNLLEDDLKNNDKIIKELASELEQSTAKVNKLASNKKEIEDNFKNICNKIQPINLKLVNSPLEQIPEQKIKDEKESTQEQKENNIEKEKEKNNKYEGLNEEELKKIRDKLLVERNDTTNLYNKIPIKVNKIEQIKKRDELEKKLAQINNDLMQIRLRLKGNI